MCSKPFFKFSVFSLLLFLQVLVCGTEPTSPLVAGKDKAYSLVASGKLSEAAAIEDKLIGDNSGDPCLPKVISDIAGYHAGTLCYDYLGYYDYDRAKVLYNRLIQLYPQNDYAKEAELKIAALDILAIVETGKEDTARNAIDQFIANNTGKPYFAGALYDIAYEYGRGRHFDKSRNLYQKIIQLCPQDEFARKAKTELMKDEIYVNFEDGNFDINYLLAIAADTNTDEGTSEVLYTAVKKCIEKSECEKAKTLCNQIIQKYPDSKYNRKAAFGLIKSEIFEKISGSDFTSAQNLTEKLIAEHSQDKETPEVLYGVAEHYVKCSNFERARKLYLRLISLYPENSYSFKSYKEISALDIRAKIAIGEYESAYKELEKFIDKYEKDSTMARICYLLDSYCWERSIGSNDYDGVIPITELISRRFHEFNHYNTSVDVKLIYESTRVRKEIADGKLAEAQSDIAKLKQNYSGPRNLPLAFYFIAKEYLRRGYADQARAMCDEIIKLGENRYIIYCDLIKYSLDIRSLLEKDDLTGAKQIVSQFKTKYANSPFKEKGLGDISAEFYDKGLRSEDNHSNDYLKEAIEICQAEKLIESDFAGIKIQSYKILGESYSRIGDYAKSADYYQKLLDQCPDSSYAWHAQFMVGRAYEQMFKAGLMSESQAKPLMVAAYKKVLAKYPNCEAARAAQSLLAAYGNYTVGEVNEVNVSDSNKVN